MVSHSMDLGVNLHHVKQLLGHKSVETPDEEKEESPVDPMRGIVQYTRPKR